MPDESDECCSNDLYFVCEFYNSQSHWCWWVMSHDSVYFVMTKSTWILLRWLYKQFPNKQCVRDKTRCTCPSSVNAKKNNRKYWIITSGFQPRRNGIRHDRMIAQRRKIVLPFFSRHDRIKHMHTHTHTYTLIWSERRTEINLPEKSGRQEDCLRYDNVHCIRGNSIKYIATSRFGMRHTTAWWQFDNTHECRMRMYIFISWFDDEVTPPRSLQLLSQYFSLFYVYMHSVLLAKCIRNSWIDTYELNR